MKRLLLLLAPALLVLAANPLQPGMRGSYALPPAPAEFRVGFWDGPKFDPANEPVPIPGRLMADEAETEYWLVQFDGPVRGYQVRDLARAGGFIGFHSRYTAFVRADRDGIDKVRDLPFIRWAGPYHPGLKYWSGTLAETGWGRVSVILFRDAEVERAVADLAALGLPPVRSLESDALKAVEVDCSRDQVETIARLPYVLSVEEWHESEPENANVQWVIQTWAQNERRIWEQGVVGSDEILGFIDGRLDQNHYAFRDTVLAISDTGEFPNHRKVVVLKRYPPGTLGSANSHGTHVGGTIAGNDSVMGGTSTHKGHSREARLANVFPIPSATEIPGALAAIATNLRNPALQPKTISNSWWTGTRGQYTIAAAAFDHFSWFNRDIVTVKSCGNQGQANRYYITEPGNSKSIIAVASLQNGTNSTVLSSFSSRGPGHDDRVKPDISAPGEGIMSARVNTTNDYTSMSGTSMAAPAINGAVGQIRSYLRKGYYPSGQPNPADTFGYVSAALLKAMVLVSADPNVGSYVVPSDYIGWGRANLDSVLFFNDGVPDARGLLVYDDTVGLATGDYVDYVFEVSDTMPLRVGVVWTDTAAAPGANPALINDLDARLEGPGGTFYLGNHYTDGRSVENPAGDPDRLNPLEMFRVHEPEPGTWTLRVSGYSVPAGGTQPYGVVITGGIVAGELTDVGVTALLAPLDTVEVGDTITPTAIVRNFGTTDETFPVHFTIGTDYDDSTVVTLTAGDADTVRFVSWIPDATGSFEFACWTALIGDENPANDRRSDTVEVIPPTAVGEPAGLPTVFALEGVRPTPFRNGTDIRYALPRAAEVELRVYNAAGILVRTLARGTLPAGRHSAHWDGRDDGGRMLSTGVYLCRFEAGEVVQLRKLIKM